MSRRSTGYHFSAIFLVLMVSANERVQGSSFGTMISHTGRVDSSPPGTGEVDVGLGYPSGAGPLFMVFNEIATHTAVFTYAPGPADHLDATGGRSNSSGIPWAGLEIALQGADFGGWEGGANPDTTPSPSLNPVVDFGTNINDLFAQPTDRIGLRHGGLVDFTVESSSILRSNNQGSGPLDATLFIQFGVPVPSPSLFFLHYKIIPPAGDPTATGFTVTMTPIPVPEPATAALLLGVGSIATIRRRRSGRA